jgi:hypothetical protein
MSPRSQDIFTTPSMRKVIDIYRRCNINVRIVLDILDSGLELFLRARRTTRMCSCGNNVIGWKADR